VDDTISINSTGLDRESICPGAPNNSRGNVMGKMTLKKVIIERLMQWSGV